MAEIKQVQFGPPPQQEAVVTMLEQWLERARKGEVKVICLAGVLIDESMATEWRGLQGQPYLPHTLGAVSLLQHRILTEG
jgi:hypothetical protein